MPIEATFCVDTKVLCEKLAAHLRKRRTTAAASVFGHSTIVVPTSQHGRWLELELARRNNIASGIDFVSLSDVLRRAADQHGLRLLDHELLRNTLLGLLLDDAVTDRDGLEPVHSYLNAVPGDDRAFAVRAAGLAERLAALYLDYDRTRLDWLSMWSKEHSWQALIWHLVQSKLEGTLRPSAAANTIDDNVGLDALAVAAVQTLDEVDAILLQNLAAHVDVELLIIAPSASDWSDMFTGRTDEVDSPGLTPPADWSPSDENPLLRLWGRAGRDVIWRVGNIVEPAFDESAPPRAGTLGTLQRDVANRVPERGSELVQADGSTQFISAPGVRRELEAVANDIWTKLLADDDIRLPDFAVVIPDGQTARYVPQLLATFHSSRRLPANLIGVPAGVTHQVVDAARRLLELPLGDLRRSEVLSLMTHPNVISGFPAADRDKWLQWADELTIIRGADRDAQAGSFVQRDLYNWDQALRRLSVGAAMRDYEEPVRFGEHVYLPPRVSESDIPAAGEFVMLARSLISDARWIAEQSLSLGEWAELFADLVDVYLRPTDTERRRERDEQVMAIGRCRRVLLQMRDADVVEADLSFPLALELAKRALAGIESYSGEDFIGGVLVGTPQTLRALPLRHVYVVGLADDAFPTRKADSSLDVRDSSYRRGEPSREDLDRYAFLELLMQARESFSCSWVGRDPKSGEHLQPSAPAAELLDELSRRGISRDEVVREIPLRRYYRPEGAFPLLPAEEVDASAQPENLHREAFREAQLRAIHDDLREYCSSHGLPVPNLETLQKHLRNSGDEGEELLRLMHLSNVPELRIETTAGEPRRLTVTLSQLRRFLESPLQAGAGINLGLYSDEEQPLDTRHEPFETNRMLRIGMLREVFHSALLEPLFAADLEELYDAGASRIEELRGVMPTGLFKDAQRRIDGRVLELWREFVGYYGGHGIDLSPRQGVEFYGFGKEDGFVTQVVDPPAFAMNLPDANGNEQPVIVEIRGVSPAVSQNVEATLLPVDRDKPKPHDFLSGYLTHLLLAATVDEVPKPRTVCVALAKGYKRGPSKPSTYSVQLDPVTPAEATAQLERLCRSLLCETHDYLFPLEAVENYVGGLADDPDYPYEAALKTALSAWGGRFRYGPVKRLEAFGPPPNAAELLRQRFRHFTPWEVWE